MQHRLIVWLRVGAAALVAAGLGLPAAIPASGASRAGGLVTITSGPPAKTTSASATFTFKVNAGYTVTFVCELDGDSSGCTSPQKYGGLNVGLHTFTVRAYAGEIGLGAASWTWLVDSTTPDFVLKANPAELPLTTKLGFSSTKPAHVQVVRLDGSKGPVSVKNATTSGSALILPVKPGLQAKVVPDNPANPSVLTVSLTAQPWALAEVGKSFTLLVLPGSPAVGPVARAVVIPYAVVDEYDLALRGLDVTQGIQPEKPLPAGPTASYGGVKLVEDKRTMVRVFAAVTVPTNKSVSGARIYLRGWRYQGGGALQSLGQPLISDPVTVGPGLDAAVTLTLLEKNPPSFTFTLPPSWTEKGPIALEAEVKPPVLYQPAANSECSSSSCAENNTYRVVNIPFVDTGYVQVWPIYLKLRGGFTACCPKDQTWFMPDNALWAAGQLLPLADGELRTAGFDFRAEYDATGAVKLAMTLSQTFGCGSDCRLDSYLIGASEELEYHQVCPGASSCPDAVMSMIDDTPFPRQKPGPYPNPWYVAGTNRGIASVGPLYSVGKEIVNVRRPLTSTAHELGHALGLQHASWGCGSTEDGQKADLTWPDPFGYIHGVGFDVRTRTSVYDGIGNGGAKPSTAAPFPISGWWTKVTSKSASWYDLMSYCAGTPQPMSEYRLHGPTNPAEPQQGAITPWLRSDAWISTRNWNKVQAFLLALKVWHAFATGTAPLRAQAEQATLSVRGFQQDGRVVVTGVRPRPGRPSAATKTDYEVVLRSSGGRELLRWPLATDASDDAAVTFLSADVPLGGVEPGALPADLAAVEVVSASTTLARVTRSASPPAVRLLTPAGPEPVGAGPTTTVTWTAADSDPDSTLRVAVDYSADDGKAWDTVYVGPNSGRAEIRSGRLSASREARLRARGERARSDAPLYLSAGAYDDTGTVLDGGSVTWYDGARLISRRRIGSITGLAPGRHILTVVARDASGRLGRARVGVEIQAASPDIVVSGAPATVSPDSRQISINVACSVAAALSITGPAAETLHTRCEPTPRAVTVTVRGGRGPVRLVLEAVAQDRASRLILVFRRRS
jgi:hypothetical protein